MNKRHLDNQIAGINVWLRQRKFRVKQNFGVSNKQLDLTRRVLKVRDRVKSIPQDKRLLVFTDKMHLFYLFKYTDLKDKNIKGVLDPNNNEWIYDDTDQELIVYDVFSIEKGVFDDVDVILGSFMHGAIIYEEEIRTAGFKGEFISIYDDDDDIAMFCVQGDNSDIDNGMVNDIGKKVLGFINQAAPNYYFDILDRIKAVNKKLEICDTGKTLVYCVGAHTNYLFEFTDIKYKNVIGFADKNIRVYDGLDVRIPMKESFDDVDHIVISSFYYQEEIEGYLDSIGQKGKVVCLYENYDKVPFYELPNDTAPDRSIFSESYLGISSADVSKEIEEKCDKLTRTSNYYITYNILDDNSINELMLRKKSEKDIIKSKNYISANEKTGIIIQGQIIYDDDFTYLTAKMYKIIFPGARIIISTWKSEAEKEGFEKFKKLGVDIVLSDEPREKGVLNLNYQLISTNAGIKEAKRLGCVYALKTRSDFRLYGDDCISYLYKLTQSFKSNTKAKERITVLPPILDVPYYIPDFIFFGNADDMLEMWSIEELFPSESLNENPEMKLIKRYLNRLGVYLENPMESMEEYMDLLARVFIVVDESVFKFLWKKYSYEGSLRYTERENRLNATDWFNRQIMGE